MLKGVEGNISEAKHRGEAPEACLTAPPGSETGACVARVAKELGRSRALRLRSRNCSVSASEPGGETGSRSAAI